MAAKLYLHMVLAHALHYEPTVAPMSHLSVKSCSKCEAP